MKHSGVRLYVKRVLVMENCEEIVPEWLRFVVGVLYLDDLPLNVSREVLQQSSAVRTIKKQVVKHVLDAIDTLAAERPEDYVTLWEGVGPFPQARRRQRFRVSRSPREASSLREHGGRRARVSRGLRQAHEGGSAGVIDLAIGESRKALESAPHLEGLRKRGYEVLLMTDPIDEWATESLREFEGKTLVSAMRADLKIEATEEDKTARKAETQALQPILDRMRTCLRPRDGGATQRSVDGFALLSRPRERRTARVRRAPLARGGARRSQVVAGSSRPIRSTRSCETSRVSSNAVTRRTQAIRGSRMGLSFSMRKRSSPKGPPSTTRTDSRAASRRCCLRRPKRAWARKRLPRPPRSQREESRRGAENAEELSRCSRLLPQSLRPPRLCGSRFSSAGYPWAWLRENAEIGRESRSRETAFERTGRPPSRRRRPSTPRARARSELRTPHRSARPP